MKKRNVLIFAVIFVALFAFALWLLYHYNYLPHKKYTDKDFTITTYVSTVDKDGDGKDDQTDILENVKKTLESGQVPQFVHVAHTSLWREITEIIIQYAGPDTVIVIEDLGKKQKKEWWKELIANEKIGVTFQLKKVGLLFFDPKMTRQHYVL